MLKNGYEEMKEAKGTLLELLLPFGAQMGHDWGIDKHAYFHASDLPIKASNPAAAKSNTPQSFL